MSLGEEMNGFDPAPLLQVAQSWWIASELVRRHPHLLIVEHHPMDGFYDSLGIVDLHGDKMKPIVDINRPGSVHVHTDSAWNPVTLSEALSHESPHDVVKRVEEATGWGSPSAAPKTTARSLTYRVIARVLASMVNDQYSWDVRTEWNPAQWEELLSNGAPAHGYVEKFPFAKYLAHSLPTLGLHGEPFIHLWALKRDDKPVAILDTSGRVVTESGYRDLLPTYRRNGRNLTRTIADALGEVLP